MKNAVQGMLIDAGEVIPAPTPVTAPALWPVTLEEARRHQYAVWEKSSGYPYDEGFCTVAVPKGSLAFQCSYRIDARGHNPLCRKHQAEYSRRTP